MPPARWPCSTRNTPPPEDAETVFWRAQTQAALGRWHDALASYTHVAETPPPLSVGVRSRARYGQGEALLALGRSAEAATAFKALAADPLLGERARLRYAEIELDRWHVKADGAQLKEAAAVLLSPPESTGSGTVLAKERAYLLGRLRLAQRQPALAEGIFKTALAHPEGLSERLMVDNYWGWARACLDEDQLDRAQDALESLVERYPRNAFLAPTFTWLEALYRRDSTPDFSTLRRWSDDNTEPGREALARLSLARLEAHAGRSERAEEILTGFEENFPGHPLRVRALLDLAALRLQSGRTNLAREALEHARRLAAIVTDAAPAAGPVAEEALAAAAWRTEVEAARRPHQPRPARQRPRRRTFRGARRASGRGAACRGRRLQRRARLVARGRHGPFRRRRNARSPSVSRAVPSAPSSRWKKVSREPARPRPATTGHVAARRIAWGRSCADHPSHPRAPEAHLALAELAFTRPSPDLDGARQELDAPGLRLVSNPGAAAASPPAPPPDDAARDRAEYLAIWLADEPGPARDPDWAVTRAKKFLTDHPDSLLAAEVRMKLGEIYFQRADYPDAQTQLELLAKNTPDSPLAEPALYLAGMSARLSMSAAGLDNAVGLFEQAAQRGGPFKLPARLQQAEVQNQLDRGRDALILYDGVLTATDGRTLTDTDLESRCAALCGRGQTLTGMAGTTGGPKAYRDAVGTFDQLASGTPGASLLWRRQALTLKGHALEKLGEPDAALAAYDDALNAAEPPSAGEPNAPEWTWFYRAGSDAARLLEARSQWPPAIAIYKKLAAADGPMKSEFETLLKRRQLEHFVWEE